MPSTTEQLLSQTQQDYRYDLAALTTQGPSRLFPHKAALALPSYIAQRIQQAPEQLPLLLRLAVQPWLHVLNLSPVEAAKDELADGLSQLVDDLGLPPAMLTPNLPPGEAIDQTFLHRRQAMKQTLDAARDLADLVLRTPGLTRAGRAEQVRSQFYKALKPAQRSAPKLMQVAGLDDREFARQRIAGMNPTLMRRVGPEDAQWIQSLGELRTPAGQSLPATAPLFLLEYPFLRGIGPEEMQPGRYVESPRALFYLDEQIPGTHGRPTLMPLLIQLEAGDVVYPSQTGAPGQAWMRAKLMVQAADMTHHELITHLGETHLTVEAFAIATPRHLPPSHPLYRLLKPHFQFLLAINTRGNEVLLSSQGAIAKLLAPKRPRALAMIDQAYRATPFSHSSLPASIARRGLGPEVLPDYPYRDDGLLLWEAIDRYVSAFLASYYPNDAAVVGDRPLQNWAQELGGPIRQDPEAYLQAPREMPADLKQAFGFVAPLPEFGRVPEFPSQITTKSQLTEILTGLIFISGPQHAAVNFCQFDYGGYPADTPFSTAMPAQEAVTVEEFLPNAQLQLEQMILTFALSGIRYGQLGSSELIRFTEVGDRQALAQFQADLKEIETQILQRNQQRQAEFGIDYPYLLPSQIPNSINI
jgi:arachidonate 15-lipoxygenase